MKEKISITIDDNLLKEIDNTIDNVYVRNRSQAIEYLVTNALKEEKIAVILAGGEIERLRVNGEFMISVRIKE